jgi:hypothetical protein
MTFDYSLSTGNRQGVTGTTESNKYLSCSILLMQATFAVIEGEADAKAKEE